MIIRCEHCQAAYTISAERAAQLNNRRVRCPSCGQALTFDVALGDDDANIEPTEQLAESPPTKAKPTIIEAGAPVVRGQSLQGSSATASGDSMEPPIVVKAEGRRLAREYRPSTAAGIMTARQKRRRRTAWILYIGAGCLLIGLAAAAGYLLLKPGGSNRLEFGRLVVDVPEAQRVAFGVKINDERHSFPSNGPIEFQLSPGDHHVVLQQPGMLDDSRIVRIVTGRTKTIKPDWRAKPSLLPPVGFAAVDALAPAHHPGRFDEHGVAAPDGQDAIPFGDWLQDVEQARRLANEQNKQLFILFDGSDWNPYSQRMFSEVVCDPRFRELVDPHYVLVYIDSPRYVNHQYVEDLQRNEAAAQQFGVYRVPIVVITDADGRVDHVLDASDQFEDFAGTISAQLERRASLAARLQEIGTSIVAGDLGSLSDIADIIPADERGFHLQTLGQWKEEAAGVDSNNEQGLYEQCFLLWLESCLEQVGLPVASEVRLGALDDARHSVIEWLEARSFRDASAAGELILQLALTHACIDNKGAQEIAQAGLTIPGLREEIRTQLDRLASDTLSNGSGFLVSPRGYLVTNAHVVEGGGPLEIQLGDATEVFPGTIVHADSERDLALIKITHSQQLPVLEINSQEVKRGMAVLALGFPLDAQGVEIVSGVISQVQLPPDGKWMKTDAKVNPGNSGGPLMSHYGQVVGVVTAKTLSAANLESMGLVIPASELVSFLEAHLPEDEFREIVYRPAPSQKSDNEVFLEKHLSAFAKVMVKVPEVSRDEARRVNATSWRHVLRPDLPEADCRGIVASAISVARSWPVGENWRTLGLACYRLGDYAQALQCMQRGLLSDQVADGKPHPASLAILAMILVESNQKAEAEQAAMAFEYLRHRGDYADDADVQALASQLEAYYQ